jgi:hypothetical protein
MALAHAGWDFDSPGGAPPDSKPVDGEMDAYWTDWGRGMFGNESGGAVGRVIQKLDGSHLAINALIRAGAQTTDSQISELFAPLRELESLQRSIRGAASRDRFDYWLNLVRATHLRVQTWVLAERLRAKMKQANVLEDITQKQNLVRRETIPLRLEIARSYENMIAAFVDCARSPGDIGTIASIESGSRSRIVSAHDSAITNLLGEPLPPETAVNSAYRGPPRIFQSSSCTQTSARKPLEIRAFVLSSPKCTSLNLHWRSLGKSTYKTVPATCRARQAYRVVLPPQPEGAVEYYVEALLDDGQRILWPPTAPSRGQTVVTW